MQPCFAGPVTVLVGPAGSRPATARRRALVEAGELRDRWRAAGVDARLAAVHAPDIVAAGVRPDRCLPSDPAPEAEPGSFCPGGTDDVAVDGAGPAGCDGAASWLVSVSEGTTVHALGWRAAAVAVEARAAGGSPVVVHVDQPPSWPARAVDAMPVAAGAARDASSRRRRSTVAARTVSSVSAAAGWAAVARCDAVVVESCWARELAVSHGVPRSRVTVAHPGVSADPATPPWRADRHSGRRLLSLGAPADVGALRCLARAALDVDAELWVGRVSGLDRRAAEALHGHLLADPVAGRLGTRLRVLADPAADRCQDVDVVADVSRVPGRGLGLLAGMAAARAVVAADAGGAGELVVHRVTGLVVPPGPSTGARRVVSQLLRDPFRLEAYGVAGLDRVGAVYDPRRYLQVVGAVHAEVAATRPRVVDAVPGRAG